MKLFLRILFWFYFTLASIAFILVIIYLVNRYRPFVQESRLKSRKTAFTNHYLRFDKPDTTFSSLFDIDSKIALDYLNQWESYNYDFGHMSRPVQISKADLLQLELLVSKWPRKFQEITKHNLLAIYIVDSARFNGLTQVIGSTDDKFVVFLNSRLFDTTPNDWITAETTKYLEEGSRDHVRCILFNSEQNIPIRTVEHVLLHEYAHMFSFITQEAPLPDDRFSFKKGYYPLIEPCFEGGYISYESLPEKLNELKRLSEGPGSHYEKLDLERFKALNRVLVNSPFPTGYSTKNASELVAELLTYYIHKKYTGQRFSMIFGGADTLDFAQKMDTNYIQGLLE